MNRSSAPAPDSGLICLLMMAEFHGLAADRAQLRHQYDEAPFDTTTLLHAAQSLGFTAKRVRQQRWLREIGHADK